MACLDLCVAGKHTNSNGLDNYKNVETMFRRREAGVAEKFINKYSPYCFPPDGLWDIIRENARALPDTYSREPCLPFPGARHKNRPTLAKC